MTLGGSNKPDREFLIANALDIEREAAMAHAALCSCMEWQHPYDLNGIAERARRAVTLSRALTRRLERLAYAKDQLAADLGPAQ